MNERLTPALTSRGWESARHPSVTDGVRAVVTDLASALSAEPSFRMLAAVGNSIAAEMRERGALTRQDADDLWGVGAGIITGHAATAVCERVAAKIAALVRP